MGMAYSALSMAIPAKEPQMQFGGHLGESKQVLHGWLHSANSGTTHFSCTRWWRSRWNWWVLDVTRSEQPQRIGDTEFLRRPGAVALYRPNLSFEEWQEKGRSAHESWILFTVSGPMLRALQALTSLCGYCHLEDPESIVPSRIGEISRELFYRQPGFEWRAQASFLELLALVATANSAAPCLSVICSTREFSSKPGLQSKVENHIRSRIAEPLTVKDLALHLGLGLSTFAHTYRKLSGETPYRTIVRLKMEVAKRLLLQEGLSVKETAARLGYPSEFQFSRSFKRAEGCSPTSHELAMTEKNHKNLFRARNSNKKSPMRKRSAYLL
jgi:AraC-like DNA-binding protein